MNKSELIAAIAMKSGQPKTQTAASLDAFVEALGDALKAGESVAIAGFGTFQVRHRAARKGRNPSTGAEVSIPASRSAAFKPAKGLKDRL
jgi:DNA-binding protein HU-beta